MCRPRNEMRQMVRAALAAPPALPAPPPPDDGLAASKRRLSAIVAYLQDPAGDPAYRDPTVMFKVVAEEHLFQTTRLATLEERADPAEAADVAATRVKRQQMAMLLKQLAAKGRPG